MGKRLFDIIAAGIGLCLLSPLFLIITVFILIFDGGNPFFIQQRIGKNGQGFPLIKFKTMKPGLASDRDGFSVGNVSRITPFGKFLRKTKLDELPQLLNVLKGEMSLVGPRPEVKKWTLVYPEKWEVVHRVKPGITDNASIAFRNEEEILAGGEVPDYTYREVILPKKLDLYVDYVHNRSFSGDIIILLKTIKTVWFN
ncbi:MAG: glycosyl transferase [bacterium]|nr:MAG: glycosyl transferase [bacterium]